jgi:acetylxylan esterase
MFTACLPRWILVFPTLFFLANGAAIASPALVSVANFGSNPTNLQMSIYVPAKLATDPAIIVAVSNEVVLG